MSSGNGWMKGEGNHWSFHEWMRLQMTEAQVLIQAADIQWLLFANRNRLVLDQISLLMVNRIQAAGRK